MLRNFISILGKTLCEYETIWLADDLFGQRVLHPQLQTEPLWKRKTVINFIEHDKKFIGSYFVRKIGLGTLLDNQ